MAIHGEIPYEKKKRRGQAIYDAKIRHLIGPEDEDKFVKIDVISGDYEIGDDSIVTGRKLRARRPDAVIHPIQGHHTRVPVMRSPRGIASRARATQ